MELHLRNRRVSIAFRVACKWLRTPVLTQPMIDAAVYLARRELRTNLLGARQGLA
jgi:hypothetical protein